MDADRWKLVENVLQSALHLPTDQQEEFLRQSCLDDASLLEEVRSLVASHRNAGSFLEYSLIDTAKLKMPPLDDETATRSATGRVVSHYRILSQLGYGGMGCVWLAERDDGRFDRRVAIKFLNIGVNSPLSLERFKREGAILGRLSHPHIAELIDAGVTPEGEPFLVLEHVQGKHIDQYCDEHRLDVDRRIELFLDVLAAVGHSHTNLIVHRDIKPANVLVRDDGRVKLLDFGIAKLLFDSSDQAAPTLLTLEGDKVLTPRFAAPEQITCASITTATDVYALGVLLYLLLSGQYPTGPGPHTPTDLVRIIVESDTPNMSQALAQAGAEAAAAVATKRGISPDGLRRQLGGDLDTIVGKALKKNPGERYISVPALADDLRRYLTGEPIRARPDTIAYRATKFVHRNRTGVIVSGTTLLLVIASLAGGLYVANRQRKIAQERFLQARQLANKFIDLDEQIRGLPGSTKVRNQIVSDTLQYLTALDNEAHMDPDFALEIALAYVKVAHVQGDPTSPNLGLLSAAEISLNNAERFLKPVLASDPRNRDGRRLSATIAHTRMTLSDVQGRPGEALAEADETVAQAEQFVALGNLSPSDQYAAMYWYLNVAEEYENRRQFDKAIRYCQRVQDLSLQGLQDHRFDGNIFGILAYSQWQRGDLDGALATMRKSFELEEKEAANGHAALRSNEVDVLWHEGMILGKADGELSLGHTSEALAAFQRGLTIAEELARSDADDALSRHEVAEVGLEIGNILRHTNAQKALAVYDHSLARLRETKPNSRALRDEAELLSASSYALLGMGRKDEARERIDKALRLLRDARIYPAEKIEPLSEADHAMRALAYFYNATGQRDKAIDQYRELLNKFEAWNPHSDDDLRDATCLSRTWLALADLLRGAGRFNEAAQLEARRKAILDHWAQKVPNGLIETSRTRSL